MTHICVSRGPDRLIIEGLGFSLLRRFVIRGKRQVRSRGGVSRLAEPAIYTVGTSTRSREEFIELLRHYHLTSVADVRSFPQSRFEHFNRENLAKMLSEVAIDYVYLGTELGGYRKGGYQAYAQTDAYQAGIHKLEKIAQNGSTAFMCAERFAWKCHRRFIASTLEQRGWAVLHIIEKDRVWNPSK
jgi:uncharacterized protein (DUF488 family)